MGEGENLRSVKTLCCYLLWTTGCQFHCKTSCLWRRKKRNALKVKSAHCFLCFFISNFLTKPSPSRLDPLWVCWLGHGLCHISAVCGGWKGRDGIRREGEKLTDFMLYTLKNNQFSFLLSWIFILVKFADSIMIMNLFSFPFSTLTPLFMCISSSLSSCFLP